MKTNIDKAINEANISIHNVNQLFSFGDFICFGDFILLWATLFSRRAVCCKPVIISRILLIKSLIKCELVILLSINSYLMLI